MILRFARTAPCACIEDLLCWLLLLSARKAAFWRGRCAPPSVCSKGALKSTSYQASRLFCSAPILRSEGAPLCLPPFVSVQRMHAPVLRTGEEGGQHRSE